jgi:hypothetical protein
MIQHQSSYGEHRHRILHVRREDFQGEVARGFEDGVSDKEDHESDRKLVVCHIIRHKHGVAGIGV